MFEDLSLNEKIDKIINALYLNEEQSKIDILFDKIKELNDNLKNVSPTGLSTTLGKN